MNRSTHLLFALVVAASSLGIGWRLGRREPAPSPVAVSPPPPTAPASPHRERYQAAAAPDYHARHGHSLKDILHAIDSARLDPLAQATVDTGISGDLFSLLDSLTPEEIPDVLAHLDALPPPRPDRLLATVLGRWARHDGAAAMAWAERLPPARLETMRGRILSGWARQDPTAAWKWYWDTWEAAPEPRYKLEQDFPLLIHAWALSDAKGALKACLAEGRHGTFDKWSGLSSLAALPERRDELMALIAGIPDAKERDHATRSTLLQWSASAPGAAAAWLDANRPDADGDLVWAVAERFGRADPRANADWLLQRTPPDQRDEAYRLCLFQWAEHSPDEAAAWLETAGPTDMSAEIFATRFARSDLEKAMAWARRVGPAKRPDTIASTLAQALIAGQNPDLSRYAADAGLSAEDLATRVEAARQQIHSRF